MNLGNSGWGIVVGWLIWIVIIPFTIEILQTVLLNNKQGTFFIANSRTVQILTHCDTHWGVMICSNYVCDTRNPYARI